MIVKKKEQHNNKTQKSTKQSTKHKTKDFPPVLKPEILKCNG